MNENSYLTQIGEDGEIHPLRYTPIDCSNELHSSKSDLYSTAKNSWYHDKNDEVASAAHIFYQNVEGILKIRPIYKIKDGGHVKRYKIIKAPEGFGALGDGTQQKIANAIFRRTFSFCVDGKALLQFEIIDDGHNEHAADVLYKGMEGFLVFSRKYEKIKGEKEDVPEFSVQRKLYLSSKLQEEGFDKLGKDEMELIKSHISDAIPLIYSETITNGDSQEPLRYDLAGKNADDDYFAGYIEYKNIKGFLCFKGWNEKQIMIAPEGFSELSKKEQSQIVNAVREEWGEAYDGLARFSDYMDDAEEAQKNAESNKERWRRIFG